jgi:hypothetical protein
LRIVCKYENTEIKFSEQTDAGFEYAYYSDHVTSEDDSSENVILEGCMSTQRQINPDLMITAVTASKCKTPET